MAAETAHSEKVYSQADLDRAVCEAGFATEPHRQLLERASFLIQDMYDNWPDPLARSSAIRWMTDYEALNAEEATDT